MNKPMVSVIVPVYNAEEFLERCVESILNQEYKELELILVNDGSQDSSGDICRKYEEKDSRVRVFSKENTGVSDSRNLAISHAAGKYLQFVDSDDWLAPDATRLLVRKAEETGCDLVIADFYRVSGDRVLPKGDIEEESVMSLEEFAAHMMENPADFYYGVLWNKLYRREVVEQYHLRMDQEIDWCEDFMFNLEYMRHVETICALRTPVYYYLKRKGSLVSQGMNISKIVRMKLMVFEYYNNFYKHILDEEDYEKNRLQVYRFLVDSAGDGIVLPSILSGAKKLGHERTKVVSAAVEEEGILAEAYRNRKLLQYYLEPVGLKCDLSLTEISILMYLSQIGRSASRDELAGIMNLSRPRLAAVLQKLVKREMVRIEEKRIGKSSKKRSEIMLLPAADGLKRDFDLVKVSYQESLFSGFEKEEIEQYEAFAKRMRENARGVLRQPAAAFGGADFQEET